MRRITLTLLLAMALYWGYRVTANMLTLGESIAQRVTAMKGIR